jgi:hypothetical protein
MNEIRLQRLFMLRATGCRADGCPHHHGNLRLASGHVTSSRHGWRVGPWPGKEVRVLNVGNRPQSAKRSSTAIPVNPASEIGVSITVRNQTHQLRPNVTVKAPPNPPLIRCLPDQDDPLIPPHLFLERFPKSLDNGRLRPSTSGLVNTLFNMVSARHSRAMGSDWIGQTQRRRSTLTRRWLCNCQ